MSSRTLAALALLASAARAQPVWDQVTKPRVESGNGNLVFNAHSDVTVNLVGRGESKSLWEMISHQDAGVASGCAVGESGMTPPSHLSSTSSSSSSNNPASISRTSLWFWSRVGPAPPAGA